MARISQDQIDSLIRNSNPGIEYEYALFYFLLNDASQQARFRSEIINKHSKKKEIIATINSTQFDILSEKLRKESFSYTDVAIATQYDEVGPSDIILKDITSNNLGLSVKYENNCSLNITSRDFLTKDSIEKGYNILDDACENYIKEMESNYGNAKNWFRKRKQSIHTDSFISSIVKMVLTDWNLKSPAEKDDLLKKLMHTESKIDFWIVKFTKKGAGFIFEIDSKPVRVVNYAHVSLTQESSSYVGFKSNDVLFGKMQVKFNNGILEKAKGKISHYTRDGIPMKKGDPFGSWNFNIIINT